MIIYEVNLFVDTAIEADFSTWLDSHIKEMLELEHFTHARKFREVHESEEVHFCVHYQCDSIGLLEDYFDHHAKKMRSDGLERFNNHFEAKRRILRLEQQL